MDCTDAMAGYTVKLFTRDGRVQSLALSAHDVGEALATAVPHFNRLGEHVDGAKALVVEAAGDGFVVFRPTDVVVSLRRGTDPQWSSGEMIH